MKNSVIIFVLSVISLTLNAQVKVAHLSKIEADFRQERTSAALIEPEITTGKFKYVYPDSVVWAYDSDDAIKLPKILTKLIAKVNDSDETNNPAFQKDFEKTWNGNTLTIKPKKKVMSNILNSISITFTKDGVADKVFVDEKSGNTTNIQFLNMTYTEK